MQQLADVHNGSMTVAEFKRMSASGPKPEALSPPLLAMWLDARGEWDAAHEVAQDIDDSIGAWIHAYLHRKEGDLSNAGYWYRRAGKPEARDGLDAEWERIVGELLGVAG